MLTIDELRQQIDELDSQIAELLVRRLLTVREIGLKKKSENLGLISIDREIDVLDHVYDIVRKMTLEEQFAEAVEKIYFSIITMSRRMQ